MNASWAATTDMVSASGGSASVRTTGTADEPCASSRSIDSPASRSASLSGTASIAIRISRVVANRRSPEKQHPIEDGDQLRLNVVPGDRHIRHWREEMVVHDRSERIGVERHRAREHLERDDAERVLVRLRQREQRTARDS